MGAGRGRMVGIINTDGQSAVESALFLDNRWLPSIGITRTIDDQTDAGNVGSPWII